MDVVEVFIEVDSISRVSGEGGERKHGVRDGTCPGIQYPKAAGVEAEFCNEEGVMREGGDADGVGEMKRAMMWLVAAVRGHSNRSSWVEVRPCRSGRGCRSPGGGVSSG